MINARKFTLKIKKILKQGGIGVIPTDTIYGLVGSALLKSTVEKIYILRKRDRKKPMIILISSLMDLKIFNIKLKQKTKILLKRLWPGRISVILLCKNKRFEYLYHGGNTLAFRIPNIRSLRTLLRYSGPLVAPSANIAGMPAALNINQSKKYFNDFVDFYVDKGELVSQASTLAWIKGGKIIIKRKGAGKINAKLSNDLYDENFKKICLKN